MIESDVLEWKAPLSADQKRKRNVVVIFAILAGLVGWKFVSPLVGFIGCAAILIATAEIFLGVSYRLDPVSATSKCGMSVTAILWEDVKRVLPVSGGLRLSPLTKSSRLDEFRGVLLRFSDNEDAVWGTIRQFWHGDTGILDGGSDGAGEERSLGQSGVSNSEEKT